MADLCRQHYDKITLHTNLSPQMSHHQDLNTFISEIENYDANMIIPANRQSHRNSTICQIIPI